jgi:hypothetical protein
MMRTLRDMNMSKFVAEDVPLFTSLIDDLFPAQKADRAQFPDISAALEKVQNHNLALRFGSAPNLGCLIIGNVLSDQTP